MKRDFQNRKADKRALRRSVHPTTCSAKGSQLLCRRRFCPLLRLTELMLIVNR